MKLRRGEILFNWKRCFRINVIFNIKLFFTDGWMNWIGELYDGR